MIGGGTPNGSRVPFPSTEGKYKKRGVFGQVPWETDDSHFHSGLKTKRLRHERPESLKPALKTVPSLLARERREILQWNPVKKIR